MNENHKRISKANKCFFCNGYKEKIEIICVNCFILLEKRGNINIDFLLNFLARSDIQSPKFKLLELILRDCNFFCFVCRKIFNFSEKHKVKTHKVNCKSKDFPEKISLKVEVEEDKKESEAENLIMIIDSFSKIKSFENTNRHSGDYFENETIKFEEEVNLNCEEFSRFKDFERTNFEDYMKNIKIQKLKTKNFY